MSVDDSVMGAAHRLAELTMELDRKAGAIDDQDIEGVQAAVNSLRRAFMEARGWQRHVTPRQRREAVLGEVVRMYRSRPSPTAIVLFELVDVSGATGIGENDCYTELELLAQEGHVKMEGINPETYSPRASCVEALDDLARTK